MDENLPQGFTVFLLPAAHQKRLRTSYFEMDSLFTASAFSARKPSPTKLNEVVRALGKGKPDTLFIGDSESDAKAANSAEISFGWAAYGYSAKSPPRDHILISQFTDVLRL